MIILNSVAQYFPDADYFGALDPRLAALSLLAALWLAHHVLMAASIYALPRYVGPIEPLPVALLVLLPPTLPALLRGEG